MLPAPKKSALRNRFLIPQQRQFRDRPAIKMKREVSFVRLLSFFFGGILLANFVLMTSTAFRAPAAQPALQTRGPAAAVAAQQTATQVAATDGRSVPEAGAAADTPAAADRMPEPVVAKIGKDCAEHAREKLMAGLTHYYLQRRLRPGASSDDAADISSITGLLAGPGDPAAMTPDTSCAG